MFRARDSTSFRRGCTGTCQRRNSIILIDETTDISILKQMIIYGCYVMKGETKTHFLGMVELSNSKTMTITDPLLQFCGKFELDIRKKLYVLGSDSESVMLGCRGGVSKLMKDCVPYLIANHCVAHHLALACGQAANEISYLKRFKVFLTSSMENEACTNMNK